MSRALNAVFAAPVGKDVVSRVWRKTKGDWDAWNARSLAEQPIVRLILDGTVARVRLDRRATSISLLVALGVRADGQKILLAIKSMGGEGEAAWRALLDDLVRRGLPTPELVVVDGAPGLEKALAALWPDMAVQRCTVHKHRNLLAHAPKRLHEEISNDYRDMIYAATRGEVETRRKAFIRKWRLKSRVVADSLEEAGDKHTHLAVTLWLDDGPPAASPKSGGLFRKRGLLFSCLRRRDASRATRNCICAAQPHTHEWVFLQPRILHSPVPFEQSVVSDRLARFSPWARARQSAPGRILLTRGFFYMATGGRFRFPASRN